MKSYLNRAAALALLSLFALAGLAGATFPPVYLKPVCLKQIHSPTTITYAPDGSGRVFVCDEPGKIYIIQGGMLLPTPFLDISATAANTADRKVISETTGYNERGLLGLAFHPGYAIPASPGYRKFYLNYVKTYTSGVDAPPLGPGSSANSVSVIAEFQVSAGDPNVATPGSERQMLLYTQPQNNHNGGQLEFGPEVGPGGERYLYIGVGDGGSQQDNDFGHTGGNNVPPRPTDALGNGQDTTRLFGKILRIDPLGTNGPGGQYGIPVNNPFVGAGGGVREEIYSFGMRNPWRFSFDKRPGGTNRMFCGDVGGDRIEEIDLIVAGGNYGWRYKEGFELPTFSSGASTNPMTLPPSVVAAMIDPIAQYAHPGAGPSTGLPELGLSVTGGFVYRGAAIPAMQGKYVFGDYGNTSTSLSWDSRVMGLEETSPGSGVFTLTQAIPLVGSANPVIGQRILCLGEDESGEIYIGMKTKAGVLQLDGGFPSGGIYKIVPTQSVLVNLPPSKDNTIFSEDIDLSRFYSDGLGYLYTGRTGSTFGPYNRRALVAFDLSGVPSGAVIQSAQLTLNLTKAGAASGGTSLTVHRLTETWGEGTSLNSTGGYGAPATTGDATWQRRFYNTSSWSTAGGTFTAAPSASAVLTGPFTTWASTAALKSDVQTWVNTPASNAGWIIRGDESTDQSACQFASRQAGGTAPELAITYDSVPPPTHFESWLATYFPTTQILVGTFVDPNGDDDHDFIANQLEYAFGFSPLAKNNMSDGISATSAPDGLGGTNFTIAFRRDPLATDLTYLLQTSPDLVTWTTIAQSVAGGAATGSGLVSDNVIPAEPAYRLVTANENLPASSNLRRYTRLRVVRAP